MAHVRLAPSSANHPFITALARYGGDMARYGGDTPSSQRCRASRPPPARAYGEMRRDAARLGEESPHHSPAQREPVPSRRPPPRPEPAAARRLAARRLAARRLAARLRLHRDVEALEEGVPMPLPCHELRTLPRRQPRPRVLPRERHRQSDAVSSSSWPSLSPRHCHSHCSPHCSRCYSHSSCHEHATAGPYDSVRPYTCVTCRARSREITRDRATR